MAEQRLTFLINAQNMAERAFKEARKQIDGLADKMKDIEKVGKNMAIAGGVITGALGAMVYAANNASISWAKVEHQIKLGGLSMTDTMPKIKQFASSMQTLTGISDEMVGEFVGRLLPVTKDLDLAFKGTRIAMDMSAATGRDLSSMQQAMTMVLSGNIEMLKRYVPEIRGLDAEQMKNMNTTQKITFAMQALERQFGGMAEAAANPLMVLKETISDLFEAIGGLLLPIIKEFVKKMVEVITKATAWIESHRELAKVIAIVVGAIGLFLLIGGSTIVILTKLTMAVRILTLAKVVLMAEIYLVIAAIAAIVAIVYIYRKEIALIILKIYDWILSMKEAVYGLFGLKNALEGVRAEKARNAEQMRLLSEEIDKGKKKTDTMGDAQKKLKKLLGESTESVEDFGSSVKMVMGITEDSFKEVVSAGKDLQKQMKDLYKDIQNLEKSYNKDVLKDRESMEEEAAAIVFEAEVEAGRLRTEIREGIAHGIAGDELDNLRSQLAKQESILRTYAESGMQLGDEMDAYQEYRGMDELQRLMADYEKKALMRQADFLEEKVLQMQRLVELKTQYTAIVNLFGAEKAEFIKKEIEKSKTFKEHLDDALEKLGNWKDAAVAVYQALAAEANAALSQIGTPSAIKEGKHIYYEKGVKAPFAQHGGIVKRPTMLVAGEEGAEAIIPLNKFREVFAGMGRAITVNIMGGYYLSEMAAEEMGDTIIAKLKRTMKI